MDAVISRIVEIEKESAQSITQAEAASQKKIEAHRRSLEEKKESAHARIIATEDARLKQAIDEIKNRTEAASLSSAREFEKRFQNPELISLIKEKIIDILLK